MLTFLFAVCAAFHSKWIGSLAERLVQEGNTVLFAYEEAIGFLISTMSYDKDGIRAAAVFNEMAAALHQQGRTCWQHLQTLYQQYGYYIGAQSYYIVKNYKQTDLLFDRLRNNGQYLTECGVYRITSVRDVTLGLDTGAADGKSSLPVDPSSQMLTFFFENGTTYTVRLSGTEPKCKWYLECVGESEAEARKLVQEMSQAIDQLLIQPQKYNLQAKG